MFNPLSNKLKILRDIGGYSVSAILSQALNLIAGFWVARLLGPADFGVWNAVSLVLVYGAYLEFGVLSAMARDLPFCHGQGDLEKAAALDGAARRVTIFGAFVAALFVCAFSFVPTHSSNMALGLQAMAVVLILQQVYTYHRVVLRSYNFFHELSLQQVLFAVLNSGLAIAFVACIGFVGRIAAAILAQAAIVLYALRKNTWKPVPKYDSQVTFSLLRVGLPIIISGFILSLLTTVDRLMVITFLDEKQLGYIGIALLISGAVSLIPGMAIQVLVPRINYAYGNSGKNLDALRSFVLLPPAILSALLPVMIGTIYILLPLVISMLLPAYTPAITAIRIIVVGIFFYCILGMTDVFLITIGKLKQYALFGCIALVLNIVLDYLFLQLGYGIVGIAVGGTLITYFFYSCIVIGYALSHYTKRPSEWTRFFLRLWLPFMYMVVLLWSTGKAAEFLTYSTFQINAMLITSFQVLLYVFACSPLFYIAYRDLRLDFSWRSLIR